MQCKILLYNKMNGIGRKDTTKSRYIIFSEMKHGTDQMKVQGKLSRRREEKRQKHKPGNLSVPIHHQPKSQ